MKTVNLLLSNLELALTTAIEARRKIEKEQLGYTTDSTLVVGWQQVLNEIKAGSFPVIVKEGVRCCGR